MTSLVSIPSLMIFSATRRRTGFSCSATQTDAEAAFADLLEQLVMADPLAGFLRLQPRQFRLDLRSRAARLS